MKMNYPIDGRCKKVMAALERSTDRYITIQDLSRQVGQSRRSTQYDICKLNNIFDLVHIPHIESRRNKGVKLLPEHLEWWHSLVKQGRDRAEYVYTQEERIAFLICKLISCSPSEKVWTVEKFSEKLSVNRSTILWDMRQARDKLADYKISLEFSNDRGYSICGNELANRSVFLYYISMLYPLIREGIITNFTGPKYCSILKTLRQIENDLDVHFQQGVLEKTAIICQYLGSNGLKAELQIENAAEIAKTREYDAVSKFFPALQECDRLYISIQLLGGRIRDIYTVPPENLSVYRNYAMILIRCFENLVNMEIKNKNQLVYNLARHLSRSFYRYKYGLTDSCVLESEITTKSKELFALVKMAVQEFSRIIGYPINDSEITFLTIHFGAHFRRNRFNAGKVRAILVVSKDEDAEPLKNQIELEFPMLNLVEIMPPSQLMVQEKDSFDIVISTQLLKYNGLYVYISNQFDNHDKQKIVELYVNFRTLNLEKTGNDIFQRIQPYIPKEYQSRVLEEIQNSFFDTAPNLLQLLDRQNIQCIDRIDNWRDAITEAVMPLIENGSVLTEYIDDLILYTELYGAFTYLGNYACLVHAKNNGNIKRSGISLLVVRDGVRFQDGKKINILVTVASVDQREHLKVLQEAVKLCDSEQKVKEIMKCRTGTEVFEKLKKMIP